MNFSDHEFIEIVLLVPLVCNMHATDCEASAGVQISVDLVKCSSRPTARFRFDHFGKCKYYDYIRVLHDPVYVEPLNVMKGLEYNKPINELSNGNLIENWYNSIVQSFVSCKLCYGPVHL